MPDPVYFKITNRDEVHRGYQWKDKINIDPNPFGADDAKPCRRAGLYFTIGKFIHRFLHHGVWLRVIKVVSGDEFLMEPSRDKWRASIVYADERIALSSKKALFLLHENGADISKITWWCLTDQPEEMRELQCKIIKNIVLHLYESVKAPMLGDVFRKLLKDFITLTIYNESESKRKLRFEILKILTQKGTWPRKYFREQEGFRKRGLGHDHLIPEFVQKFQILRELHNQYLQEKRDRKTNQ